MTAEASSSGGVRTGARSAESLSKMFVLASALVLDTSLFIHAAGIFAKDIQASRQLESSASAKPNSKVNEY